jgi:hypothetical protein
MTSKTRKDKAPALSLKDAFEVEFARREMERRKRDEEERRQQEEDLARAEQLLTALNADPEFLNIQAYFEAGKASVTAADKRTATTSTAAPRKQQTVESVEEALAVIAQFLVDETR